MSDPGGRDDRIRLHGGSHQDFERYAREVCGSDFEGCFCTRPKDHDGLHRCGDLHDRCDRWTDEQAMQWWEQFRKGL